MTEPKSGDASTVDIAAELSRLSARVADLERLSARVAELERVWGCGDADRLLDFAETCKMATKAAPATVRGWWNRPAKREAYSLSILFARDASGRLISTPRRIAKWQAALRAKWGAR